MLNHFLREGFRLTHRQIGLVFLDLLWKVIWLVLTLAGFLLVVVWFGSAFRSMQWADTGNRAINTAIAIRVLREFWLANWPAVFWAVAVVLCLSSVTWFLLEAACRAKILTTSGFATFLVSNILKSLFILAAGLALAAICFGRYFITPVAEWSHLWPDTRGAALVVIVTVAAMGFVLTIFDTLVRSNALELLGTDLFRVTALIGILLLFEMMVGTACVVMLGAGWLNVTSLSSALAMLGAMTFAVSFLNVVHSYLLLVRYSAVGIMRQNVIEI